MPKKLYSVLLFSLLVWPVPISLAEEKAPFPGIVNANNINIRSDSTAAAQTICIANKGDRIEVISESYDWYKIRLPKNAPSFIKKNLVELISEKAAKVTADRVNIRLEPSISGPIIGKANKEDIVGILEDAGSWYKIAPAQDSFGWIHKKFVDKAPADIPPEQPAQEITAEVENKKAQEDKKTEEGKASEEGIIVFEGIVKPYGMVFGRKATHKLITRDNQIILLKADKKTLDKLNQRKVEIRGRIIGSGTKKYPLLEVTQADILE